jgi:hypothetical protein
MSEHVPDESIDELMGEYAESEEPALEELAPEEPAPEESALEEPEEPAPMQPALQLQTLLGRRYWVAGVALDPGRPVDLPISGLSESQLGEIELKRKANRISVEEVEIPLGD